MCVQGGQLDANLFGLCGVVPNVVFTPSVTCQFPLTAINTQLITAMFANHKNLSGAAFSLCVCLSPPLLFMSLSPCLSVCLCVSLSPSLQVHTCGNLRCSPPLGKRRPRDWFDVDDTSHKREHGASGAPVSKSNTFIIFFTSVCNKCLMKSSEAAVPTATVTGKYPIHRSHYFE